MCPQCTSFDIECDYTLEYFKQGHLLDIYQSKTSPTLVMKPACISNQLIITTSKLFIDANKGR